MQDCYNRCLCATCRYNNICKDGCEMCEQMKACRFIIARGKCANYKADNDVIMDMARASVAEEVKQNGTTDRSN